jgi:hypothetical protein
MALAAMTALARQQRRRFAGALLGMLLAAVAVTRPATVLAAAGFPGQVTVGVALRIIGAPDPSPLLGQARLTADKGLVAAQRRLGDAYWTAFVTANVSRADAATPILTQAPPAQRAGLLEHLRRSLVGGWDGAPGGLQRAVVGVTALVSTGVFAVVATALAMLALISKTLLFVLMGAAVFVVPLATDSRNWRRLGSPTLPRPSSEATSEVRHRRRGSMGCPLTPRSASREGPDLRRRVPGPGPVPDCR